VSFEAKEGVYRISVDGDGLSHKIIESKAVYQVIKEKPEIKYKFLEGIQIESPRRVGFISRLNRFFKMVFGI
ncbi:MAG: hypothetical protein ISS82_05680, partial [Nanoarchaeota archaeon]|nr:hypothetical protein [Nanoarchaeota archaeon]